MFKILSKDFPAVFLMLTESHFSRGLFPLEINSLNTDDTEIHCTHEQDFFFGVTLKKIGEKRTRNDVGTLPPGERPQRPLKRAGHVGWPGTHLD